MPHTQSGLPFANGSHTTKEEWRSVLSYEGVYQVSSAGRVRRDPKAKPKPGWPPGALLTQRVNGRGYEVVYLTRRKGVHTGRAVHVLVAEAFIGPKPVGHEVNHRDGVKTNNVPGNLEYLTHRDNVIHAVRTGLLRVCGEDSKATPLNPDRVREIRRMRADGLSQGQIAARMRVARFTVQCVLNGTRWSHVA